MQYRSGPSLGLTYEEARAAGLQSAANGKAAYLDYVAAYSVLVNGGRVTSTELRAREESFVTRNDDRFKGTLSVDTFSRMRIQAAQAINVARTKPKPLSAYAEAKRDVLWARKTVATVIQTNSKIPMKKERR